MPVELDMPSLIPGDAVFLCPQTKLPLRAMSLEDAKAAMGPTELVPRTNEEPAPFGVTATLMVRSDNGCAYPVVDGIPILLAPEQITPANRPQTWDLKDVKYAEAYEEMTFYNQVAKAEAAKIREAEAYRMIEPVLRLPAEERGTFPEPKEILDRLRAGLQSAIRSILSIWDHSRETHPATRWKRHSRHKDSCWPGRPKHGS